MRNNISYEPGKEVTPFACELPMISTLAALINASTTSLALTALLLMCVSVPATTTTTTAWP